jgi:hypothetical protein
VLATEFADAFTAISTVRERGSLVKASGSLMAGGCKARVDICSKQKSVQITGVTGENVRRGGLVVISTSGAECHLTGGTAIAWVHHMLPQAQAAAAGDSHLCSPCPLHKRSQCRRCRCVHQHHHVRVRACRCTSRCQWNCLCRALSCRHQCLQKVRQAGQQGRPMMHSMPAC